MKEQILQLLRETDGFLSGEELSSHFGVSRTSIWKAIRGLESKGYVIQAVRNKGYRLVDEPDLLTKETISLYLQTDWAGQTLHILDAVDSTNNEAKRQAELGAEQGLLVIGEEQTAGRGRRGRSWSSKKGEGIFMSLLLRPQIAPDKASMLTLVMGMAVRDALAEAGVPDVRIKWPNDVICSGKKVCGILTEMSLQLDYINHIVIGVGINVHNPSFSPELSDMATSVLLETGQRICRAMLVADCMRRMEAYYATFLQTEDMSALKDRYEAQLINCGRRVSVLDPKESFTGIDRGINAAGELIVETDEGTVCVSAGEVSVRGVYGYV